MVAAKEAVSLSEGRVTDLLDWLSAHEPADIWAALVFAACAYALFRIVSIILGGR